MKREVVFKILFLAIVLSVSAVFFNKLSNYFDARISYESLKCHNDAYMIYTKYDNQIDEVKNQDWFRRIDECSKIEANYQSKF